MRSTVPALLFCMAAPVTQVMELRALNPIAALDAVPSVSGGLFGHVPAPTEMGGRYPQQSLWLTVTSDARPVVHEIESYARLEAGWDGNEGRTGLRWSVDAAIAFAASLPFDVADPIPMISSAGEAGLYWMRSGAYAEVGFDEGGTCYMFAEAPGMASVHFDDKAPDDPALLAALKSTLGFAENVLLVA